MKLYNTFDYELPLGGVRSFDKGLFEPSKYLLEIATNLNSPVILFADICSALRFKEWDYNGYYLPFKKQLQEALLAGHDVQLHIHPHWMTSEYINGSFVPSKMNMLSHFATETGDLSIENIIKQSVDELTSICREVKPDYQCVAYRAGSFNLAPETKRIFTGLMANGITIDSSIPKNYYLKTDQVSIDHRHMPKPPTWFFSPEGPVNKPTVSGVFEVSIAGKSKNFITNFPSRLNKKKYVHRQYDHTGTGHIGKFTSYYDIFMLSFAPRMLGFDNYFQSTDDLVGILKHNLKKYDKYPNADLSLISHPKAMGPHHLSMMKEFIEIMQSDYADKIVFSTFQKLHQEMKLG